MVSGRGWIMLNSRLNVMFWKLFGKFTLLSVLTSLSVSMFVPHTHTYIYIYTYVFKYMYVYINIYIYIWTNENMYVCVYLCTYVCMYVCVYVCMFKMKGCVLVCHTVSGLKCGIRRTPPRLLEAQKNTWGGYISRGQVKYFSEFSCLTPPQKKKG